MSDESSSSSSSPSGNKGTKKEAGVDRTGEVDGHEHEHHKHGHSLGENAALTAAEEAAADVATVTAEPSIAESGPSHHHHRHHTHGEEALESTQSAAVATTAEGHHKGRRKKKSDGSDEESGSEKSGSEREPKTEKHGQQRHKSDAQQSGSEDEDKQRKEKRRAKGVESDERSSDSDSDSKRLRSGHHKEHERESSGHRHLHHGHSDNGHEEVAAVQVQHPLFRTGTHSDATHASPTREPSPISRTAAPTAAVYSSAATQYVPSHAMPLRSSSPPTPSHAEQPSACAKDFQRLKLLGKGDIGRVYLVRHIATGQIYAMKVLPKEEMKRKNKVKRVHTEREILHTAKHPFVVTLYWSFQNSVCLYFVMEFCAGGEFFRALQRQPGKCLQEDHTRFYAAEVLLALEYLHMLGFIYRDLKPENILLLSSGHVVLTDFDLSKAAATRPTPKLVKGIFSGSKISTEPGIISNSFVGTEEYIAPEVITGFGHTSSVDWWTFGILIYEMLYGTSPFHGKSREETFSHILNCAVKFPEHRYPVSKQAKDIVKKLLVDDPAKRLGSVHGACDVKNHRFFDKTKWSSAHPCPHPSL
eukprot:TRINITY_DN2679_c0_g1_i3.p1 TRINITY_DN2679_c0_g1~~TRINITY_DN2679_c0_g1_i3.p1  ORF type:complete len:586 (-),score=164.42 TRINITY_DN2679_c0_g1_i3:937-2694(-)